MTLTKGQFIITPERDRPILLFLWRWKLASTSTLSAKFFQNRCPTRCYQRLTILKRYGVIEQRCNREGSAFYWSLTKKGFDALYSDLPSLHEEGFKSEYLEHDVLTTAVHIGDWLVNSPKSVRFYSEQQLRRVDFCEFPHWIPQSKEHRPDGYWGFVKGEFIKPVALEVELNHKPADKYQDAGEFYSEQLKIHRVLWVVNSKTMAKYIQSNIEKGAKTRTQIHNFILVDDFKGKYWDSKIILGPEKEQTVFGFFSSMMENGLQMLSERPTISPAFLLLDGRKSYKKSKTTVVSANV